MQNLNLNLKNERLVFRFAISFFFIYKIDFNNKTAKCLKSSSRKRLHQVERFPIFFFQCYLIVEYDHCKLSF